MKKQHPEVLVRIRPFQSSFSFQHQSNTITIPSSTHDKKDKIFEYHKVFSPCTTNEVLWEEAIEGGVGVVAKGRNLTLIAYGVTGSGKTHTIFGSQGEEGVAEMLFRRLIEENGQSQLTFSFYEIYNENIIDLLSEDKDIKLNILEEKNRTIIPNLTQTPVATYADLYSLIQQGITRRSQSPTFMNQRSSRSHAILQLTIQNTESKTKSKVTVIDLAGSQRTSPVDSSKQMMEGASINKSLLALGNCLNVLSDSTKSGGYIPYRDSKLTRILKDSLSGNAKLVMIACVSGNRAQLEETVNTLIYASRASKIKWVQKEKEEVGCGCGYKEKWRESERCVQLLEKKVEDALKQLKMINFNSMVSLCNSLLCKQNRHSNSNIPPSQQLNATLTKIMELATSYKSIHNRLIFNFFLASPPPHHYLLPQKLVLKDTTNTSLFSKKTSIESLQHEEEEIVEELQTQRMKRDLEEGKKVVVLRQRVAALTLR